MQEPFPLSHDLKMLALVALSVVGCVVFLIVVSAWASTFAPAPARLFAPTMSTTALIRPQMHSEIWNVYPGTGPRSLCNS